MLLLDYFFGAPEGISPLVKMDGEDREREGGGDVKGGGGGGTNGYLCRMRAWLGSVCVCVLDR